LQFVDQEAMKEPVLDEKKDEEKEIEEEEEEIGKPFCTACQESLEGTLKFLVCALVSILLYRTHCSE